MPVNGRIIEWDALEWRCGSAIDTLTESGDGDPTYSHSASAAVEFAPDAVVTAVGISLTTSSSFDGTSGVWEATYDGPGAPFGGWSTGGASYLGSVEIVARATVVKQYCKLTGSLIRLTWGGVNIYVNGAFVTTLAGSAIDLTSSGVGPNYVPLIGIPLRVSGGVAAGRANVPTWSYDPCAPAAGPIAYVTNAVGRAWGGWRFMEDGVWYEPAVDVYAEEAPGSGPFGLTTAGILSGSSTWDLTINSESSIDYEYSYLERAATNVQVTVICESGTIDLGVHPSWCQNPCTLAMGPGFVDVYTERTDTASAGGGSFRAVPNLERSIQRLGESYRALWYRIQMPEVTALVARSWVDGVLSGSDSESTMVYPATSAYLGTVGNATHPIEDPLGVTVYCPGQAGRSQNHSLVHHYEFSEPCACPPPSVDPGWASLCDGPAGISCAIIDPGYVDEAQSESVSVQFPYSVGPGGGYQSHFEPEARYLATWPNPHWMYLYWFEAWFVDGAPLLPALHWGPIRQQHLTNPALPPGEDRKTRNSLIASPIENEQGNTPFLDATVAGLRFLGVSRWQTEAVGIPSELQLSETRPGLWVAREDPPGTPDCTITLTSSGIELSGFNASPAVVDLDLVQFVENPYCLLALAKAVEVGWDLTNVDSITVSLVGADGEETVLGTVADTYAFPVGSQSKYAGTWGIDNGAGLVTDTGTDLLPEGESSTVMASDERVLAMQYGLGVQYEFLRFTVTPTSMAGTVTLDWPRFELAADHPQQFWESGKTCAMIWPDGPGIRWGQWTWYDPDLGWQDPPLVNGLGVANTIIDWLAFKHRVLLGDGGASLDGTITTELSSLFDAYEGQSIGVVDKFSHAFLLPKGTDEDVRGAMVNSFSELPPMACFPFRKRNTSTWLPTGNHAQVVYDMAEEKRPLVSRDSAPLRLRNASGTDVGSARATPPSGWQIWEFAPALLNDEVDWHVTSGTVDIAHVRPFIGWLGIYVGAEEVGEGPFNLATWSGQYYRAWSSEGNIMLARAQRSVPPFEFVLQVTATGDDALPRLALDRHDRLILVWHRSGTGVMRAFSADRGATWTTPETFMADRYNPTVMADRFGRLVYGAFGFNSGTSGPGKIYLRIQDPADASPGAAFAVSDGTSDVAFEAGAFHLVETHHSAGRWVLTAKKSGATEPSEWVSSDLGVTWEEII